MFFFSSTFEGKGVTKHLKWLSVLRNSPESFSGLFHFVSLLCFVCDRERKTAQMKSSWAYFLLEMTFDFVSISDRINFWNKNSWSGRPTQSFARNIHLFLCHELADIVVTYAINLNMQECQLNIENSPSHRQEWSAGIQNDRAVCQSRPINK
jgi:hypothetical protein